MTLVNEFILFLLTQVYSLYQLYLHVNRANLDSFWDFLRRKSGHKELKHRVNE